MNDNTFRYLSPEPYISTPAIIALYDFIRRSCCVYIVWAVSGTTLLIVPPNRQIVLPAVARIPGFNLVEMNCEHITIYAGGCRWCNLPVVYIPGTGVLSAKIFTRWLPLCCWWWRTSYSNAR